MKRGHRGLRVLYGLIAGLLAAGALAARDPGRPAMMAVVQLVGAGCIALLAGFAGVVLPSSALRRDRESGGLALLLMAGRRPWEIVVGHALPAWIASGLLMVPGCAIPILLFAPGTGRLAVTSVSGVAGAMGLVVVAVIWFEVVAEDPRRITRMFSVSLFAATLAAAGIAAVAVARVPAGPVVLVTGLLIGVALVRSACAALAACAPDHADDAPRARRRRGRWRTLADRPVRWPVFEASRIATRQSGTATLALLSSLVGWLLAVLVLTHRVDQTALVVVIAVSSWAVAAALATETLVVRPDSLHFATLAATPMSASSILWQRALGKARAVHLLPLSPLLAVHFGSTTAAASALGLLGSYAAMIFCGLLAARARTSGPIADLAQLALGVAVMAAGFDMARRVASLLAEPTEAPALAVRSLLYLCGAVTAWHVATRRLDAARRSIG